MLTNIIGNSEEEDSEVKNIAQEEEFVPLKSCSEGLLALMVKQKRNEKVIFKEFNKPKSL